MMRAMLAALLMSTLSTQSWAQGAASAVSRTGQPTPDLRSGSVELLPSGGLGLRARFTQGTFDPATTFVQFNLNFGVAQAAVEQCRTCDLFLVDINGGAEARQAKVLRRAGGERYEVVANVPVWVAADGVDVSVPASVLPPEFERLVWRIVTSVKLTDRCVSMIRDRLPEDDRAPAVLVVARGRRTKS